MKSSLRNRIAGYYLGASAIISILLYGLIYGVVHQTVYNHLNDDLNAEVLEVSNGIVILDDQFLFANPDEWDEREHGKIEVNPTFIQIVDTLGQSIRKTPNLLESELLFHPEWKTTTLFNTQLDGSAIRQIQKPVTNPVGRILGYLLIAIPLAESALVLYNLKLVLLLTIPVSLLILYLITRGLAGWSIKPLNDVITSAENISRNNLNHRIPIPTHQDELHRLATTLNNLLNRLEQAFEREKQFTSDASHELRTPLAVIRGTLEVLIRKPRETAQYEEKIQYCIRETDRMSNLLEQLLLLARFDSGNQTPEVEPVILSGVVNIVLERLADSISEKRLTLHSEFEENIVIQTDREMLDIILVNIMANAIKYSNAGDSLTVTTTQEIHSVRCTISDSGPGMTQSQLDHIFDRFYRTDESRSTNTQGMGLAIVKKLVDLQGIDLKVESQPGRGTRFTLQFKSHNS